MMYAAKAIKQLLDQIASRRLTVDGGKLYEDGKERGYINKTHGYRMYGTYIDGKSVEVLGHRLMYAYYYGVDKIDANSFIRHKDGDRLNNTKENLEEAKDPVSKKVRWKVNENGCFVVVSHTRNPNNRYPTFYISGKRRQMNRYFYEECFGEIPVGLVVMHTCDNTKCINPEHLRVGTQLENIQDMINKGRDKNRGFPRLIGSESGRAKLTESQVLVIKRRLKNGETIRKLAKEYGLGKSTIGSISSGKNWKHVVI